MWQLKYAKHAEHLRELEAGGMRVGILEELPELTYDQNCLFNAYCGAAGSRPPSMGNRPCTIPLSESVLAYQIYRIDGLLDPEDWVALVSRLDSAYCDHWEAEADAQQQADRAGKK